MNSRTIFRVLLPSLLGAASISAQTEHVSPIADSLRELGDDVRVFEEHVVTLANPFMDGRLPGTRGMEIAKEYCEYYLKQAGVQPAFRAEDGSPSWRQPFALGGKRSVSQADFSVGGMPLAKGRHFNVLGLGSSGSCEGEIVFVGYGIGEGPGGYAGLNDDLDLSGKIALVLRFEPMDEKGDSRWAEAGWSERMSFRNKVRALERHRPAAILFANPPGANDPRANELVREGQGGRRTSRVPVLMISNMIAEKIVQSGDRTLLGLRKQSDEGGVVLPLGIDAKVATKIERTELMAENVAGLLPGRGALADEVVVMGAHLDHLGMGEFGSRSGPGTLHPGADDNASGSAAVLMLADKLVKDYAAMDPSQPARSMLFILFSAEESGLNGSQFYCANPIRPLEQHALMCNFDMIGRIRNGRLSVSGADTGEGMGDWLAPMFEKSPLTVVQPRGMSGASDHAAFYARKIPILFAIIADFHSEYHTPEDVSWKINRVGGAQTVALFHDILQSAATRTAPFEFAGPGGARKGASSDESKPDPHAGVSTSGSSGGFPVRFGVMPSTYESEDPGIPIGSVPPGSPAANGGVKAGDRLMTWNGAVISDVRDWMRKMAQCKPGQVVKVGVDRDGKRVELDVKLGAPQRRDG